MAFTKPSDSYFDQQWHLVNTGQTGGRAGVDINIYPAWNYYLGQGINIGVYDDGTYVQHPDLRGNWDQNLQPTKNGKPYDPNPLENPYREPVVSAHGTAVAGLIAAPINGIGVVGVAPEASFGAMIVILGKEGYKKEGSQTFIEELSNAGYKQFNIYDVVNHSYGTDLFKASWHESATERIPWQNSIDTGRKNLGVVHVVAAGNSRSEGDYTSANYTANMRQNVVVAAGSDLGDIINYSTPGPSLLITAPVDVNITLGKQYPQWAREIQVPARWDRKSTTTDIPGKENGFSGESEIGLKASLPPDYSYTTLMNGTSAAAPMVSGVVSLMLEANPKLGYRDVQEILAISSKSPWQDGEYELYPWQTNGASYFNGGGFRYSHDYGFGFVDAAAAVRLSESWQQQLTRSNEQEVKSIELKNGEIPSSIENKLTFEWDFAPGTIVEWAELKTRIDHSWWGDLNITLTSPSGTNHILLNRVGVTPDFVSALQPNTDAIDLFGLEGSGVLDQPFTSTVSRGEDSGGKWKLEINGRSTKQGGMGGTGNAENIELSLYGRSAESSIQTYYFTDRYSELLRLDPSRRLAIEKPDNATIALNFAAYSNPIAVNLNDHLVTLDDNSNLIPLANNSIPIFDAALVKAVFGGGASDKITGSNNGSELFGGWGDDSLFGGCGWDLLDGGVGNDLIRAGIGRDAINGGKGSDELHGGFGWNTFQSESDGMEDLFAITSDQWVINPLIGKAGNNPNGEKADVLNGLDSKDQIKIIGAATADLTFAAGATAHGVSGIGIYAGGALEALYTGGDLSVAQLRSMTSGDASAAAMANQISSYGWAGV